jgi:hypothetical protein
VTVQDLRVSLLRASAARAHIIERPSERLDGRRFGVVDPEAHQWWFFQRDSSDASENG